MYRSKDSIRTHILDLVIKIFELENGALDHGLVATICHDLKIEQRIADQLLCHSQRKVSPGKAVLARILNGLGFTNR